METIMTTLTPEEQTFLGAIVWTGIATSGACLTGVVGIDFDGLLPSVESGEFGVVHFF